MSNIVMTIDRLPIEILEMIFDKLLWEHPEELYRLRAVSRTWKSIAERSGSRVFKYWYNRCKKDIPEDHLLEIVQAKYPLVAQPWRECYWVDCGLPHVAKNVYNIWKNFPNLDEGIDNSTLNAYFPVQHLSEFTIGMNDKYFAVSYYDEYNNEEIKTEIYGWDNPDLPIREFNFDSGQIDFYTTEKGTFIVLAHYHKTDKDWEIYISKYPIDKPHLPFGLFSLGHVKNKYFITQNECFYIIEANDSTVLRTVEHKILTEQGFTTNTIIEPPAELPRISWAWIRVEICGCTLYVMQNAISKLSIAKYKISRNSDGKLLFTFEECQIVDEYDEGYNGALYNQLYHHFIFDISSENLSLTDTAFASAKFHPWLSHISRNEMYATAVHANYVFCAEYKTRGATEICVFHKDDLIACMEANDDPDNLKCTFTTCTTYDGPYFGGTTCKWIGIIYVGLKAHIAVHFDTKGFFLINFY